ncbi:DEAD/DEAH box helicase family protein [Candidatus Saccharibacteria bacterium]|nr:DEAD/DEAH box helicase family protein [Candidatus Saccharibacteria bacterium]
MELKEFQLDTVNKSVNNIYDLLEISNRRATKGDERPAHFVLKSCTGSGKTIMLAEILRELKERDLSEHYVFVWAAPNKLHAQSQKKLEKILCDTEYKMINIDSLEAGELQENTIIFTNWEKVFKRASKDDEEKDIKKGEFNNVAVRRGENGRNIQDVMDATRAAGLKTIIIADESHQTFYGENSQLFVREVIKPSLVIEASATPRYSSEESTDLYRKIVVNTDDVVDSGLIKKQVCINDNIEEIAAELNREAIKTAIVAGLKKRDELEKEYDEQGIKVNPLMVIQLPTEQVEKLSELDMKVRNIAEEVLSEYGYEYYQKNLAVWLSEEKENLDDITNNSNIVEVLIFKQAIALGWDCPRAQVLVMLRDIKSEAFQIQTVGRVLRMPEAKHYGNDLLDSAYVYVNSGKTIKIDQNDEDAKNLIKYKNSYIHPGFQNIVLPDSVYVHRIDYGDLKANFKKVLEGELDLAFRVGEPNSKKVRYEKIDEKLEIYPEELNTPVISDVVIKNIDDVMEQNEVKTINLTMDAPNIERVFRDVLRGFCGKFKNFARSETKIVGTLKPWFKKAGIEWDVVQRIFTCSEHNQQIFSEIFDRAIDQYDKINRQEMIERRQRQDKAFNFSIPESDKYSDKYSEVFAKKNIMVPYFRKNNAPTSTEIPFEEALEKSSKVEWWYKNGEKMDKYFAIKYYELGEDAKSYGKAFYPDYIVKFMDGRIGIFDTKSGWTAEDAAPKANALQKYISEHGKINLTGGIINVVDNRFYLNKSPNYEFGDGKTGQWELFEI